jgi:hypothetical protein
MQVITLTSLSNAINAEDLLTTMLEESDGTIRIDLGDGQFAGMQVMPKPDDVTDETLDDWFFYDFLLNETDKTIQMDEETTGAYSLEQIPDLIEYRLNKIIDLIE